MNKPVGVAIRELRAALVKDIQESKLDLSVVVLVLQDLLREVADAESRAIQEYQNKKDENEQTAP